MKSVKRLLSVLIVLLTCISLFAGGSAESTAGERTKITVLLNTGGNDETYRTWSQILDKFGEEHGLTIEYELIANKADYMNKLQLYISSDQLPDIYGCFNGPYSDAAKASGQLLNTQKELEEQRVRYFVLHHTGSLISCHTSGPLVCPSIINDPRAGQIPDPACK